MLALSILKENCTRAKITLVQEETDDNELLQRDWNNIDKHEIVLFSLSVRK